MGRLVLQWRLVITVGQFGFVEKGTSRVERQAWFLHLAGHTGGCNGMLRVCLKGGKRVGKAAEVAVPCRPDWRSLRRNLALLKWGASGAVRQPRLPCLHKSGW